MTPIDSEHAALLRGIAKNTNDRTAQLVYADWLQEHNNPGWIIIRSYHIREWLIYTRRWLSWKHQQGVPDGWRLPWLDGHLELPSISNGLSRIKAALRAYADGKAIPFET